jgi:hypothetical protein
MRSDPSKSSPDGRQHPPFAARRGVEPKALMLRRNGNGKMPTRVRFEKIVLWYRRDESKLNIPERFAH